MRVSAPSVGGNGAGALAARRAHMEAAAQVADDAHVQFGSAQFKRPRTGTRYAPALPAHVPSSGWWMYP